MLRAGHGPALQFLESHDFDVFDTVSENQIDQFVAGMVALAGDFIQIGKNFFPDADGDDSGAVVTAFFDFQRFVIHRRHLTIYFNYRLTSAVIICYNSNAIMIVKCNTKKMRGFRFWDCIFEGSTL